VNADEVQRSRHETHEANWRMAVPTLFSRLMSAERKWSDQLGISRKADLCRCNSRTGGDGVHRLAGPAWLSTKGPFYRQDHGCSPKGDSTSRSKRSDEGRAGCSSDPAQTIKSVIVLRHRLRISIDPH
jgi:hypothetical protein